LHYRKYGINLNLEFILENYHPLHFRIRDKQGLNNNAGGLWVKNSYYFEKNECSSIFIPRVYEIIKIKTGKNKYILVGNIFSK